MDAAKIVNLFNDAELDMSLADAYELADRIVNEFQPVINTSYANGHKVGVTEGRIQARNEGLTVSREEMIRLRSIEDYAANEVRQAVPGIVADNGRTFKIVCIKALRDKFPFLSIAEAKKLIEDHISDLERAESYEYEDSYGCDSDCPVCNG